MRGVALEFSLSGELEGGKEGHRGGKLEPADVTHFRFVFPVCKASFDKAASGPLRFHVGQNRFSGPFLSS